MRNKFFITLILIALAPLNAKADVLRVCSEPNNLPFSNKAEEGFENKIADLVARDLGDSVEYSYAIQNARFVKHTLNKDKCDVMMGVSVGMDEVDTTEPYYASTYVFVTRKDDNLHLTSMEDPRLHTLKIGVHLMGEDSAPPEVALGQEGIVDNVKGYVIYSDFAKPNPPARLIEAVENKDIDVAAMWGPIAAYFAKSSPVQLDVEPITGTEKFKGLPFQYTIAMGVHKGNTALRDKLNQVLANEQPAITKILQSYGIPLIDMKGVSNEEE